MRAANNPVATRSYRARLTAAVAAHSTSPSTRSVWRRHTNCAISDPIEYPTGTKLGMSSTSATATTSSAQSSNSIRGGEIPCPWQRWSKITTRPISLNMSSAGYHVIRPVQASECSRM